jgi:hypothetical protein
MPPTRGMFAGKDGMHLPPLPIANPTNTRDSGRREEGRCRGGGVHTEGRCAMSHSDPVPFDPPASLLRFGLRCSYREEHGAALQSFLLSLTPPQVKITNEYGLPPQSTPECHITHISHRHAAMEVPRRGRMREVAMSESGI